tara:strand:+ start:13380 stop:14363 length:984 start_codon:yes stop_codon:yes gene_type:complete
MINNRLVYMNGEFVPESEAKLSIFDSALMFGDMVFEMTRSFNKKQFKLREHLERLYTGIKILQIPMKMKIDDMEKAVYKTIEKNEQSFSDNDEHRIMIDVSRGLLGIYQGIDGAHIGENVIIADFPLKWTVSGMGNLFDTGINAVITSQRAIPANLMDPKIKNRSRLFYLMANIEASTFQGENNWALLLDTDGFIAEGTGDNFFIIKDGIIITPEGRNILRGISRDYVMNTLCTELNLTMIEKNIEPYDVYTADEAFMTGTPFCMLPVTKLNSVNIGDGKVGKVFHSLISQWSNNTNVDIIEQIKDWNNDDSSKASNAPTPYRFRKK